jgi:hypothetical protein
MRKSKRNGKVVGQQTIVGRAFALYDPWKWILLWIMKIVLA